MPKELIGLLGSLPIAIGIRRLAGKQKEVELATEAKPAAIAPSFLGILSHPKTYFVATVPFANGGDNTGVYTPLFASMILPNLILTLLIFLLLVMVGCWDTTHGSKAHCTTSRTLWSYNCSYRFHGFGSAHPH
ncbi:MAG TPA: cadmium resistance transporter [Thermodesulfobacteriota bacterium]|nr:cadmium resistance transporter [Thermodesulfobacteriota bacterium]